VLRSEKHITYVFQMVLLQDLTVVY